MIINYKKNNLHALSSYDGKELVWLSPGMNEFPSHIWKIHEKDKEIVKMLDDKIIELFEAKVTYRNDDGKKVTKIIGKDDEPLDLKLLDEKKAIEVVKSTYKKNILERWNDEEFRHKVKRELEKQMKALFSDKKESESE